MGAADYRIVSRSGKVDAFGASLVADLRRVHGRYPRDRGVAALVEELLAASSRALPDLRINAADPGYTATDFNGHSGPQTVTEGTDAVVELATRGGAGPTGTFVDRSGVAPF